MTPNEKLDLLQSANQYNFDELVKIFHYDTPDTIAKSILTIYFRLSQYIVQDKENIDNYNSQALQDGMYYLQSIYEAILQLDNVNDAYLKFTIK